MVYSGKLNSKIRYIPAPPPTDLGGGGPTSVKREFRSYTDTDYEFMLYRTRDRDLHSSLARRISVGDYERKIPPSKTFDFDTSEDISLIQDDENLLFDFPDELDAWLKPNFWATEFFTGTLSIIFGYFFSDNHHKQLALYYFLSWYFYFSEYRWPIVALYFPMLNYLELTFTFGWDAFLEQNFFACFFALYLPVFIYFYCYYFYSLRRSFFVLFSFLRLVVVFYTIFFFCLFFPVNGLSFLFFLPAVFISTFFVSYYPYSSLELYKTADDDFYWNYSKFLLPAPVKEAVKFLPLYKYEYPYFATSLSGIRRRQFTRFPFLNVSKTASHYKRVKFVLNYRYSNPLFLRSNLPHNFSHLEPSNFSGFLFSHFPQGFGYSAESHVMLEGWEKYSSIEFDIETGLRPDNYTVDFIVNELGVSNVRFSLSENYHRPCHYRVNFDGALDGLNIFTPQAFSLISRDIFGAYYELGLWLIVVKPSSIDSGLFSSFETSSDLPPIIFYANVLSSKSFSDFFIEKSVINFNDHSFIQSFYLRFFNSFYPFLHQFFLRFFGFYFYKFSNRNSIAVTCADFSYIFLFSYLLRPSIFKEFFRFIVFIDKNYKSKHFVIKSAVFFAILLEFYSLLCVFELRYFPSFFTFFFRKRFKYVHLCRIKLSRILKKFNKNSY